MPAKSPKPGELEPIERASRDEIAALQLERLKWSVRHAYDNVPHYRKSFDEKGVHPDDLKTLSDLARFPFTTKTDLRDTRLGGNYQIRLTRDGHLDNVEVLCELQRELSGALSDATVREIAKELQHHIKTIAGISTKVTVLEHESIPRTLTGKARRVIDERPKQI